MVEISPLVKEEICSFNEIELWVENVFDHNSWADIVGTNSDPMLQESQTKRENIKAAHHKT